MKYCESNIPILSNEKVDINKSTANCATLPVETTGYVEINKTLAELGSGGMTYQNEDIALRAYVASRCTVELHENTINKVVVKDIWRNRVTRSSNTRPIM